MMTPFPFQYDKIGLDIFAFPSMHGDVAAGGGRQRWEARLFIFVWKIGTQASLQLVLLSPSGCLWFKKVAAAQTLNLLDFSQCPNTSMPSF